MQNFVLIFEGMWRLGRHYNKWEDNIKISIYEIRWDSVDRFNLAQNRK